MSKLTTKQQRFVSEYLIDGNATQAAIRAGYSQTRARATGADNVANRNIAAAISVAREKAAESVAVDIVALARSYAKTCIDGLAAIATDTDAPHAARVAAYNSLIDRGFGRAQQKVEYRGTVTVEHLDRLTDEQLQAIALGESVTLQ